ncbi:ABC transporter substrate-binding protein [Tardiphaga sp. 538_B7_N1_4]|jgi:branched-chain amino acid transport system substrate-binding protein|uniref:ABC transporter substrate-binding protein n=1 Tax=Tardiphaga sp. 538_B7_N1_4 TaxID=3240778 RepID=UPI001B8A1243|nr:ABC transporter substrate-binding protein [Bradyrhizobium diazoefficiens]MBR0967324.1 ABC transporter substrate-binding protein [Bradyrhizobium diazoefficiens]MBR0976645.1 ABC transporter substrate-binding protein [Bradyrhizobium diazoefficiens]MBR1005290.1 ABC transporter substrate-binding protein [Bradyrhizobium diazoefficiens]MBR1011763.1 ABC transporter substrate-binding protein [Bradyrhizobium diazoefficiens]MBR1049104.1 ABC transporter substrate-binding protein [Bradyrhizobium diazoef
MKALSVAFVGVSLFLSSTAYPQTAVKIGVLTDLSGPYADLSGEGSIIGARLAVEEFKAQNKDISVEVISADHQNKPDIGGAIARKWFDQEKVDAIIDVANSGVALAISQISKDKDKVFLGTGAASSDLTGKACSPNTVHWTYDTYALSHGTGGALVKAGGDSWFFLTADYAFGQALERDTSAVVIAQGGKVAGSVRHPLNTSDFSSFLLQAQAAKTKVIGLANAGADTINAIKQASEFGITEKTRLAALLFFITDVHSLGLKTAHGLVLTEAYYWDLNDETRAFSKRFAQQAPGRVPSQIHAGAYSATLHYLKAIAVAGNKSGAAVVTEMKKQPTKDIVFGDGSVREDGRHLHDMYLFEVKKPEESKGAWDYYKLLAKIPAEDAFRPLSESTCPLVKK